jgi:hypothetical protein
MEIDNFFKGKITISTGSKTAKKLTFRFTTEAFSIDQVVMANFDDLAFSNEEKRILTAQSRHIIRQYQKLNSKELKKFSKELISLIKKIDSDEIKIEACDAGAFICLSSIFSGKLPKSKELYFTLKSAPIKLFPKNFISNKKAVNDVSIKFNYSTKSWLRDIKTLQSTKNFKIIHPAIGHDFLLAG